MKRQGYSGGAGRLSWGYTIVETMIFLAVSGGLLLATVLIMSGRQERVRFTQSVEQLNQDLQDIANDVATGVFPSNSDFSCRAVGSGSKNADLQSSPQAQGTNSECVFVGKLVMFSPTASTYTVYTMVKSTKATDLFDGNIMLLGYGGSEPGIAETIPLEADLRVRSPNIATASGLKNKNPSAPNQPYDAIVVANAFQNDGVQQTGGSSKIKLYGFKGTVNNQGLSGLTLTPSSLQVIEESMTICAQQPNGRRGSITLTKQLTFDRTIDSQPSECTS